jgi:undecaprenyl diphosphate synthase
VSKKKLSREQGPRHVAIIMDGNGRWAKERGLPRTAGHREGVKRLKEVVKVAPDLGIEVVTFYAFSTENWSRPSYEVSMLMRFLDVFLEKEVAQMHRNNVRFCVIGAGEPIPARTLKKIRACEERTRNNTSLTVVLALNYGSRQEIVEAARAFARQVREGVREPDELTMEEFGRYLYTADLPDPDLLIRTSGEMRISNFLLWQISYAELYFPEKYWPDFSGDDLAKAVEAYRHRERRFGGVHAR